MLSIFVTTELKNYLPYKSFSNTNTIYTNQIGNNNKARCASKEIILSSIEDEEPKCSLQILQSPCLHIQKTAESFDYVLFPNINNDTEIKPVKH